MLPSMDAHTGPPAHGPSTHQGDESTAARYDVVRLVQRLTTASGHFVDRAGGARGLHRSDLEALQVLVRARESGDPLVTAGGLARALSLSPSATTALVDRLERAGHVRRAPDEHDRRRVGLEMTETAGAEARALFGPLAASMLDAMDELDDAEIAVVTRFLTLASEVVEDQGRA